MTFLKSITFTEKVLHLNDAMRRNASSDFTPTLLDFDIILAPNKIVGRAPLSASLQTQAVLL